MNEHLSHVQLKINVFMYRASIFNRIRTSSGVEMYKENVQVVRVNCLVQNISEYPPRSCAL